MEDDSTCFNVQIHCKICKEFVYPGLRSGLADGHNCLFRNFDNKGEAELFYLDFKNLSGTSYVPHPKFKLADMVCLDAPLNGVRDFFIDKRIKYFNCGKKGSQKKWFPFIERDFRQIFTSAINGMITLWRHGYAVRNINTMSTITYGESISDLRFNFLDICSKEVEGAMVYSIIQLRELMKEMIALIGFPYDHTLNGVSQDVLNFLTNTTDAYMQVEFMDPIFLLNDPWTWNLDQKVIFLLNTLMFIEDNKEMLGMEEYYTNYPNAWVDWIKPGSFIDQLVTLRMEKKFKREVPRGVLEYKRTEGFRNVVKIGWDSVSHNNKIAAELGMPYSTLKASMANVDDTFNCLCSHIFWYICNLWFSGKVPEWKKHMFILGDLATWDQTTFREDTGLDR